jgi:glycosyltransferase involved in cell wall biosynthesis
MYSLPNKVFEYLAAGVPVIGANFPEVRKLVEGNGVGKCFDPDDPISISETLNFLSNHPDVRNDMRQRIPAVLKSLDAESEWQKIVRLYNGLAEGCEL